MTLFSTRRRLGENDLAPLLLFIALAALACITPPQNDTWWHLRSGQEMWGTRSFLLTESFSHTAAGAPLNNHWWLSQLAFYGAYSLGGPFLLTLFAGACALAAIAGSWVLTRGPWSVRLGLLAWLMITTASGWAIRPQVISLALLAAMAHAVVANRLWLLPVICVIWANAHALVLFGVVMSGAVFLEALIWSRSELRKATVIAALSAAAPLVTPLGWSYWPQILSTVSVSRTVQIAEYMAPFSLSFVPFWCGAAALFLLAVRHRHRFVEWRRSDRVLLLASAVLFVAGVMAQRNVAFFALVAAPVLSRLWPAPHRNRHRPAAPLPAGAFVMLLLASAGAAAMVAAQWRDGGRRLGWEPMSPATLAAIDRCPDPLFNELKDGGPLMWALPHRRVFIDSRMEAYPLSLLRQSRRADVEGDYREPFMQHRIACALATTGSRLAAALGRDGSLSVAHTDGRHTVFVRTDALLTRR